MNTRGELTRDPDKGKISGVCAGVAEYFGIELWLVRIFFIRQSLANLFFTAVMQN